MSGEYRANDGTREKVLQPGTGNVRITSASKRVGHGAFARSRSGQRVGSCPADVMLVFGDVGELRKVAESANDLDVLTMREAIQCRLELVPRPNALLHSGRRPGFCSVLYVLVPLYARGDVGAARSPHLVVCPGDVLS